MSHIDIKPKCARKLQFDDFNKNSPQSSTQCSKRPNLTRNFDSLDKRRRYNFNFSTGTPEIGGKYEWEAVLQHKVPQYYWTKSPNKRSCLSQTEAKLMLNCTTESFSKSVGTGSKAVNQESQLLRKTDLTLDTPVKKVEVTKPS